MHQMRMKEATDINRESRQSLAEAEWVYFVFVTLSFRLISAQNQRGAADKSER